jgi:hypothetical protein
LTKIPIFATLMRMRKLNPPTESPSPKRPQPDIRQLVVHTADTPDARREFDHLLEEKHYLGAQCQGGDYLRQIVYKQGEPVALLAWGACCYALKTRDEHIGWNPTQRAERQKLVVQNRRFLLLHERGEEPNLASQSLAAALRALPDQWYHHFGYTPLLAETFTDIESYNGTCYKASGWIPLGISKGYSRHHANFFTYHGEPKKCWVKPLRADAITQLCAAEVPPECEAGAKSNAQGVMPLNQKQLLSLFELFRDFEDPRRNNKTYSARALICIIVMAMMAGKNQITEIHRFGRRLTPNQRAELGLPRKKGTKFRKAPSYTAYYHFLKMIDSEQLAQKLNPWLIEQSGQLPGDLAFDGKMVRDTAGVLTLVDIETGDPRAMIPMRHKEDRPDGELTQAKILIDQIPDLSNQLLSADALHTQKPIAKSIVEKGGDYLLQIKDNQPTLNALAKKTSKRALPV